MYRTRQHATQLVVKVNYFLPERASYSYKLVQEHEKCHADEERALLFFDYKTCMHCERKANERDHAFLPCCSSLLKRSNTHAIKLVAYTFYALP